MSHQKLKSIKSSTFVQPAPIVVENDFHHLPEIDNLIADFPMPFYETSQSESASSFFRSPTLSSQTSQPHVQSPIKPVLSTSQTPIFRFCTNPNNAEGVSSTIISKSTQHK